jgi:hypothetical protein
VAAVPAWLAARGGLLGDTGAVDRAGGVDQFLAAHAVTPIYAGAQVLTPNGSGAGGADPANFWAFHFDGFDYDQPFTMSGTKTGRVVVPLLPVGNGADLQVSLCPDVAGVPGAPIVSTRVPAKWIAAFAAAGAAPGPATAVQLTAPGGPLALPQYNTPLLGGNTVINWASPTASGASSAGSPSSATSGNYFIQVGGLVAGAQVANVFTIAWNGAGALAVATPQPALPQPSSTAAVAVTATTVVVAGGLSTGGAGTANVYAGNWNPGTGQLSAWSSQAALPQVISGSSGAAWGSTVYVVGGNVAGAASNALYWATVNNGQIQAWNTAALPAAVASPFVAAVNGFLIVAGGFTTPYSAVTSAVYYAPINADGSLGSWQAGPALPVAAGNIGNGAVTTASGMAILGGNNGSSGVTSGQFLTVGASGPGSWQQLGNVGNADSGVFAVGPSQWRAFTVYASIYQYADLYTVPRISVPLPAAGLTNGATYHVLLTQPGGDIGDYLRTTVESNAFPGNPTVLFRARGASSWTAFNAGFAIPVAVYDQTPGGQVWHTWDDAGARISTLAWATTPDARLLGVAEAIAQPGPVLNGNWTFTAGTAPWAATNGTLAQSSAQVHGGLPFSALLTPAGSTASAYIECELVAVTQGRSYVDTAWLFSPTGYASVALNVNWYRADRTFLSTSSGAVAALAANTWTQYSTTATAPANAAYGTIVAIETGTPPASALLYVSAATLQDTVGPPLASIAALNYGGNWPSSTAWPPLSIAQLA